MVYGLYIKPYYGPNRDPLIDHGTRLIPLDGDIRKVKLLDKTPDGGCMVSNMHAGRPVDTKFMPRKMQWSHKTIAIPDFQQSFLTNVSEQVKDFIEEFEPNMHQFTPIDVYLKNGTFVEKRYVLIPCNRIDSMDHDLTTMILFRGRMWRTAKDLLHRQPDEIPEDFDVNVEPKIVFSRAKIGDLHLWVDKYDLVGAIWLSNALAEAMMEAGFTGVQLDNQQEESA